MIIISEEIAANNRAAVDMILHSGASPIFKWFILTVCSGPAVMDKDPSETGFHPQKQSEPRVLEPALAGENSGLEEECKEFVDSTC